MLRKLVIVLFQCHGDSGWLASGEKEAELIMSLIAMCRLMEACRVTELTGHSTKREREREWKAKQTK